MNTSLNQWILIVDSHLIQPPRQDGDFSEQRFRDVVNAALANNIGNMLQVSRLSFFFTSHFKLPLPCDSCCTAYSEPPGQGLRRQAVGGHQRRTSERSPSQDPGEVRPFNLHMDPGLSPGLAFRPLTVQKSHIFSCTTLTQGSGWCRP